MSIDILLLASAWLITIILLVVFVPRNKIRHGILIFLFKQFITWILGLIVAEFILIEYPVRSFPRATRSSFDFEYFVYPALCVLFNLHYPVNKNFSAQLMHYVYFCSGITAIEITLEKYTNLIEYINWAWYTTWISLFITFYLSRRFYLWFFNLERQKEWES
ncbi:CBO0543 family protein [Desulfotomaculum defluvii]